MNSKPEPRPDDTQHPGHPIDLEATTRLVAAGEMAMPDDLDEDQQHELSQRVRQLRRDELVAHMAERIAHRIWHDQAHH